MLGAQYWQLFFIASSALLSAASPPSRTGDSVKRNVPSHFVTTQNGRFVVNDSEITFVGTNAYWLGALNSDKDVDLVFDSMQEAGVNIVRTWAFNDVETIPENGTWFQHIQNGTVAINNGTNGLQRLDKIVKSAQDHGIYLIMSLTNNWNPQGLADNSTIGVVSHHAARNNNNSTTNVTPKIRNKLSNDYGGMDAYVRQFSQVLEHDQFYVHKDILKAFKNYTKEVVKRYVDSPAIFAWELANDPRCHSTLPAGQLCDTQRVTQWHAELSDHVAEIDPRHLVTSGNQGFFCTDCPKLFTPTIPAPPPPVTSPAPGQRRRSLERMTRAQLLEERKMKQKQRRRAEGPSTSGIRVRGRWIASHATRQDSGLGPAFDGSQGVDSEDILNAPSMNFGTFQLFPDQNNYGIDSDPSLSDAQAKIAIGTEWIRRQAQASASSGKPVAMTSFGLVTQGNARDFVPFNATQSPFKDVPVSATSPGVSIPQRDNAYGQWFAQGIASGLSAMLHYQWGQSGLTAVPGTAIAPISNESGLSPIGNQAVGLSPNDGYGTQSVGDESSQTVLGQLIQSIGSL